MVQELLNTTRVVRVSNSVASGTGDVNGTGIDLAAIAADAGPFNSITFIAMLGTSTGTSGVLKAQQSSDDGSSDAYADLEGTGVAYADTDDDGVVALQIRRPREQWVRPVLERTGGSGVVVDGIIALLGEYRSGPPTSQDAIVGAEVHDGPAEGTA